MELIADQQLFRSESDWKENRLLLVHIHILYLLNPAYVTNHHKDLMRLEKGSDIAFFLDYLTIKIVPKEKELKESFRGFGCMTTFLRHKSVVIEQNMKLFMADDCDEQAMTLTELGLLKKLYYDFRILEFAFPGNKILTINVDSTAWNNKFSQSTVDPVMKETVSRIFGTQLFNTIHSTYRQALVYVDDEQDTYYWYEQDGGIEGYHQDSWVWVHLSMVHTTLSGYGFEYTLLCKGDDLRVFVGSLIILSRKTMGDIRFDVINKLRDATS